MEQYLVYLLFILGFYFLLQGGSWLVDGASSIAKRYKISNLVIGLTVVAFGTSAPELVISLLASFNGNTDIAIGNILGSNIANILLILGIAAIIYPLTVHKNTVWKEVPLSLLAVVVLGFLANDVLIDGASASILARSEGIVLIGFFIIFLYYMFGLARSSQDSEIAVEEVKQMGMGKSVLLILTGLIGLVLGGQWVVDGAVHIARLFNISDGLIALTVIAVGTSLPELATSAIAAYKKETDIAVGNVVGSNIFNVLWILGLNATIIPLPFNTNSNFDILMTVFASLLLLVFTFLGKKRVIGRLKGIVFILIYIAYVTYLVLRG
ncbi:MAG: calcium/sodium antiporter [Candidatus Gracilibacteria bacterium]